MTHEKVYAVGLLTHEKVYGVGEAESRGGEEGVRVLEGPTEGAGATSS